MRLARMGGVFAKVFEALDDAATNAVGPTFRVYWILFVCVCVCVCV